MSRFSWPRSLKGTLLRFPDPARTGRAGDFPGRAARSGRRSHATGRTAGARPGPRCRDRARAWCVDRDPLTRRQQAVRPPAALPSASEQAGPADARRRTPSTTAARCQDARPSAHANRIRPAGFSRRWHCRYHRTGRASADRQPSGSGADIPRPTESRPTMSPAYRPPVPLELSSPPPHPPRPPSPFAGKHRNRIAGGRHACPDRVPPVPRRVRALTCAQPPRRAARRPGPGAGHAGGVV